MRLGTECEDGSEGDSTRDEARRQNIARALILTCATPILADLPERWLAVGSCYILLYHGSPIVGVLHRRAECTTTEDPFTVGFWGQR
jgi:hypothetical protein